LLLAAGLLVLLVASFSVTHRRALALRPIALAGMAWCVLAPIPTLGVLFVGPYLDGSRYLYLAAVGWGLILASIAETLRDRRVLGRLAVVIFVGLLAAVIYEQQTRLSDWQMAAALRDVMVRDAMQLAADEKCAGISVTNLPAQFNGAQLFNNGFIEAVGPVGPSTPSGRDCRWRWNGRTFIEE